MKSSKAPSALMLGWCVLLVVCLVSSSGCATPLSRPKSVTGSSFTFSGNYDDVWEAVVSILEEEEIPILTADKASGYIETKTFPLFKEEYKTWAKKPWLASSGFCMLEIGVAKQAFQVTTVGIKAYFKREKPVLFLGHRGLDPSRGVFEALLAGRMNDRLVKKKFPKLNHIVMGCKLRYAEPLGRYVIVHVEPGHLADEQGLKNGDVLLQINGENVHPGNLFHFFLKVEREAVLGFLVERRKKRIELPVRVYFVKPNHPAYGMTVERDQKSRKFKISYIREGSPADKAGIQAGDFLLKQNGMMLDSWTHYYQAFVSEERGKPQAFQIEREGRVFTRELAAL